MVTETVSPLAGITGPVAEIIPESATEVVPNVIACEGVSPAECGRSRLNRNCADGEKLLVGYRYAVAAFV